MATTESGLLFLEGMIIGLSKCIEVEFIFVAYFSKKSLSVAESIGVSNSLFGVVLSADDDALAEPIKASVVTPAFLNI